uniref:Uncharacterized protein n=1 Tax=Oryza rufipogon TaxID=4529 RepID=A0A0E0RBA8_ORYRU
MMSLRRTASRRRVTEPLRRPHGLQGPTESPEAIDPPEANKDSEDIKPLRANRLSANNGTPEAIPDSGVG